MNYHLLAYLFYLPVSILLTIWVGRTLFKNGKHFLHEIFYQQLELADAVNRLLIVGFYLINIGYAVIMLKIFAEITDAQEMIEVLSTKLGVIILFLGGMHFFNLFILFRLRRKAKRSLNSFPSAE